MSHQSELIATDINAYLAQHERKELLRLLTCGSVDDGKSTLIGRLLHDSKMIYEDQLAAIEADSVKSGTTGGKLDLALSRGIPFKFSLKNFEDVPEDLEVNFYVETEKGETLLWLKDLAVPARHYFRQAGDFKIVAAISKRSDISGTAVKVDVIPATMKVTETAREKPMSLRLDTEILQLAVNKLKK